MSLFCHPCLIEKRTFVDLHVHKLLLHSVIFIDFFFVCLTIKKMFAVASLVVQFRSFWVLLSYSHDFLCMCLCAAKSCPGPLSVGVDRPFKKAQAINLRLVHNTRLNRRLLITSFHKRETDFRKNPRCRLFELSSCCTRRQNSFYDR